MDTWVTAHFTGGLGNRLFELAAALGAAEKWNQPCVFLKSAIEKNDHGPADTIVKLYPNLPLIDSDQHYTKIIEPQGDCFKYIPLPEDMPFARIRLEGWRQTPKYFPKDLAQLKPAWEAFLSPTKQESLRAQYGLRTLIERETAWLFHIRLGDYKVLPHHQIPVIPYYEHCLQQVPNNSTVLLFSDEPQLCKNWFIDQCVKRELRYRIVEEQDDVTSLWLMSQCWGGAIVANSTFSWWGAFFAHEATPNPGTFKAFYPSVWGQGLPPAYDILPSWGTSVLIQ